ncbi:MAG: 16S rRNA (uracil(1498)-N(3))-methyltransferase [Propioniciclava sp.]
MTDPLFLADLNSPEVGAEITLDGDEGRHAAAVRRIRTGETILVSDGAGTGARGEVVAVGKGSVTLRVDEVIVAAEPAVRFTVVQALAKGDRAEAAVEMLTEVGVDRIIPWQASRSVVRWAPERRDRQVGRWRATAREAAKQSRRLRVPVVTAPMTTAEVAQLVAETRCALVLHEDADIPMNRVDLPAGGDVLLIVGPEGGITTEERSAFVRSGAAAVVVNDAVLRTSTAGVVGVAQVQALLMTAGATG